MPIVPAPPGLLRMTTDWPSRVLQSLRERARDDIGRAAGAVGHDDLDGAGGVGRRQAAVAGRAASSASASATILVMMNIVAGAQIRVTRTCRIAARPPRTSLTQRSSAAGTSSGSLTFSP